MLSAYEAVIANEDVSAHEDVPYKLPVIPSNTATDPLKIAGPMLVNVLDPLTRNDPDISRLLVVFHVVPATKVNGCVDPDGPCIP
jgi:hypothetical protein